MVQNWKYENGVNPGTIATTQPIQISPIAVRPDRNANLRTFALYNSPSYGAWIL